MKRTVILVLVLVVPPIGTAALVRYQEYPKRFAEVIPGGVYRGAFPTARQIDQLHDQHRVRTIVSLTGPTTRPVETEMLSEANRMGMNLIRFPMPGDGRGDFQTLDQAADAIANKNNWPVFFHCEAGKQRSNAALGAFWIKHRGYTSERAIRELIERHGLDTQNEAELVNHIRGYESWLRSGGRN